MSIDRVRMDVIYRLLGLLAVIFASRGSIAADWDVSPSLNLAEIYSDNINLAADDGQDEFVTEVTPALRAALDTRRLDLTLDYRLQGLYFAQDQGRNVLRQQASGSLNGILVKDLLFLDGQAVQSQTVIDATAPVSQGNIAAGGNIQNVLTTSVSPYLRRRLGSWALADLRYTRSTVNYEESDLDSIAQAGNFTLRNLDSSSRWSWSLGYFADFTHYLSGTRANVANRRADLGLGYRMSGRLNLTGAAGYERNHYPRAADTPSPEGAFWNLGVDWQPTPRTRLAVSGGKRYFGSDWRLDLQQTGRRTTFGVQYSEGFTTRRQFQLELNLDAAGLPIIDPTTQQPTFVRVPLEEVFLSRRGRVNLDFRTRRTNSSFNVYEEHRDYQQAGYTERVRGAGLRWQWSAGRRMSFVAGANLTLSRSALRADDRLLAFYASATRNLSRWLASAFELRRTQRSGPLDYVENQAILRLTLSKQSGG